MSVAELYTLPPPAAELPPRLPRLELLPCCPVASPRLLPPVLPGHPPPGPVLLPPPLLLHTSQATCASRYPLSILSTSVLAASTNSMRPSVSQQAAHRPLQGKSKAIQLVAGSAACASLPGVTDGRGYEAGRQAGGQAVVGMQEYEQAGRQAGGRAGKQAGRQACSIHYSGTTTELEQQHSEAQPPAAPTSSAAPTRGNLPSA